MTGNGISSALSLTLSLLEADSAVTTVTFTTWNTKGKLICYINQAMSRLMAMLRVCNLTDIKHEGESECGRCQQT